METKHAILPGLQIRWLIRRDLLEVLSIEKGCFGIHAWSEEEFLDALRQRNCIAMVAELDGRIAGYVLYLLEKGRFDLINIAVAPTLHRHGIGSRMIDRLVLKLSGQGRSRIKAVLVERNLGGHLFFRSQGFVCSEVMRNYYENGDAGYLFVLSVPPMP